MGFFNEERHQLNIAHSLENMAKIEAPKISRLLLASKFDCTKFDKFLGCGSFGLVLQTKDTIPTAVKLILEDPADDVIIKNITREYDCIEATQTNSYHPNIVKTLKYEQGCVLTYPDFERLRNLPKSENYPVLQDWLDLSLRRERRKTAPLSFFIMEMELCGNNLRSWIEEKSSPTQMVPYTTANTQFWILHDIIQGLKFLHGIKIIHRDLRPENVMFSGNGYEFPVKLGDFGLARKVHSQGSKSSSFTTHPGSTLYNAPETCTSNYGLQADLYSLGLVILEVVSLKVDNERNRLFNMVKEKESFDVPDRHMIFTDLAKLITSLTNQDLAYRTKTIDEVNIMKKRCVIHECIERFIGRGRFAYVFQIRIQSEELVAKMFFQNPKENDKWYEKLEAHCNNLKDKRHLNIVQIKSATHVPYFYKELGEIAKLLANSGHDKLAEEIRLLKIYSKPFIYASVFVIQMELVGPRLRDWLNANSGGSTELLAQNQMQIVQDVLEGLKFLHSLRIIHGSLKPESIMFSHSTTNVFEFPVKIKHTGTPSEEVQASQRYVAPEITEALPGGTFCADVFSLGIIILETITLEKDASLSKSDLESLTFPPLLSIGQLIACMTSSQPDERPQIGRIPISKQRTIAFINEKSSNINQFSAASSTDVIRILSTLRGPDKITIILDSNSYQEIVIDTSNVELRGEGGVVVDGIKITHKACDVIIKNLTIQFDHQVLIDTGCNRNVLEEIRFLGSKQLSCTCDVRGDRNLLHHVEFDCVEKTAISTSGNDKCVYKCAN